MLKLEKVEYTSLAIPLAIAMIFLGFIAGILYSVLGAIYDSLVGQLGFGTILAFFAIIGMPLIFGVFGFIVGTIGAFLNNLVVAWIGK